MAADSDFYFEGTAGSLKHSVKDVSGLGVTSKVGFIAHAGAGKEWRLLSGLTLAFGGRVGIGSIPAADGGTDPTVGHFALCLALGYSGG